MSLAEHLITLATPHGIDLRHIAGIASRTDGAAAPLRRVENARGKQTRTYRAPAWTHAELGQALHGVPRMPELAAYYSLCGYLPAFGELHRGLMLKLLQRCTRDQQERSVVWPMSIRYRDGVGIPYDYLPKLAMLVLIYEANKQSFISAPGLPAVLLNVEAPVWARQLAPRYDWLSNEFQRWLALALGMIGAWIRGPDRAA